jgi:predicted ATP-grasp superfamily ATP-dependent carboligase
MIDRRSLPPVLLGDATWYGSLAAVRDLGSRGVPVTLAADAFLAPARWSRFVNRTVRAPGTKRPKEFLAWLHAFGDANPGHVLYPTSDDAAWIIANDREALARKFKLYSPAPAVFAALLDKGRLAQAARAAGLPIPETWAPESEAEVEQIARTARFPLFIKPRSQVLAIGGLKGGRVDRPEDLVAAWKAGIMPPGREELLGPAMRGVAKPVIQACYPDFERIYTVDGFVDRAGHMVTMGCNKLLQRPRRKGPGVIFEEAPIYPAITAGLQKLWRQTGFFGVFDVEFVVDGDRVMLIDLNPRFYNHMIYEVDRGLPLPWMAYLGALGDDAGLAAAMREVKERTLEGPPHLYVHQMPTRLLLAMQGLAGNMTRQERAGWRRFVRSAGTLSDPSMQAGDRMPWVADYLMHLTTFLRHPRSFLQQLAQDDARPQTVGPGAAERPATAGEQVEKIAAG